MPNPLNLLQSAVGQAQDPIIYAEVRSPAPASFAAALRVTIPDWSPDYYFDITGWPQIHGATLPAENDPCVIIRDSRGYLRCIWWAPR